MTALAILDHLWQSTLLALLAGLLVAALRKAPAGVRYGLWFAASLKFLVPFAALAALGRLLASAGILPARAAPQAAMIEQAARPLARFPFAHDVALQAPFFPSAPQQIPLVHATAPVAHAAPHLNLGLILLTVWVLGSAVVLFIWALRWVRVHKIVRSAVPLAWPAPMPVLASSSLMEPGLVGFLRPVLVVPETLPERLTRSEIDAILAHEISHFRRRDNLTAAIHMLVEALFWFHPLVWWIGARLIEERERACDEAVVRAGHDRAAYARSLVESARLFLQSPLDCVAGASGSNLKMRVEAIMTAPATSPLSPLKKALLLAAGACAFATPVTAGLLSSPEGQKAVTRVTAAASRALGVPAGPAPDTEAAKPVVLARNETLLPPALSVATDAAPGVALARTVAAPSIDTAPAGGGTEDAVRRWILALQTHQFELADMTPAVEQSARQQWAMAEQMFRSFGALKDLRFVRVTPDGDDAYEADFAHGKIQVMVGPLTADGKLARLAWGPLWSQTAAPDPGRPLPPQGGMQAPIYRWGSPASAAAPAPSALAPTPNPSAPINPAEAKALAANFVTSYADATPFHTIGRWGGQLCVHVVGLAAEQTATVRTRVQDVAASLGLPAQAECQRNNLEIGFTNDPQGMLRGVGPDFLGDRTSDTRNVKTDSLPIQGWYVTNGELYGAADTDHLKALVVYQDTAGQQTWIQDHFGQSPSGPVCCGQPPGPQASASFASRRFRNVFVIVDLRKTGGKPLGVIADYVAMLALSQPRALGQCNALPSITDLFADCVGRPAPGGLTPADAAYLTALYSAGGAVIGASHETHIVQRMADILANPKVASR